MENILYNIKNNINKNKEIIKLSLIKIDYNEINNKDFENLININIILLKENSKEISVSILKKLFNFQNQKKNNFYKLIIISHCLSVHFLEIENYEKSYFYCYFIHSYCKEFVV